MIRDVRAFTLTLDMSRESPLSYEGGGKVCRGENPPEEALLLKNMSGQQRK